MQYYYLINLDTYICEWLLYETYSIKLHIDNTNIACVLDYYASFCIQGYQATSVFSSVHHNQRHHPSTPHPPYTHTPKPKITQKGNRMTLLEHKFKFKLRGIHEMTNLHNDYWPKWVHGHIIWQRTVRIWT